MNGALRLPIDWLFSPAFLQAAGLKAAEHRIADIFRPLGSQAESEQQIAYLTFAITGAIFVVVAGIIVYTIARFRRRSNDNSHQEPAQVYGSNQIEVAWTVIPILIVFVLIGVSGRVIASLQNASPPQRTVKIRIVGHQWWWEVHYPDYGFVTANEVHLPASTPGRPAAAYLTLESQDVIHSFWIPQLSGKTDLVPNRSNYLWIDAKEPGVYLGNCAEYCGTQHANMLLRVVADTPAEWKAWTANQQRPAVGSAAAGGVAGAVLKPVVAEEERTPRETFESLSCVSCHMVKGTAAAGQFGPDLTHLMSRSTLGAGVLDNTHRNLREWIDDPHEAKPGCLMPSMKLTPKELDSVVSYLETLK